MFIYNYAESFDYMERGFILINIVAKKIFDSYTMALFLQAAILFTFQTIAVKKISPLPMTTLMIMWGTDFCNVFFVRQSVAISLLFFSILAIRYRKIGLFLLLVLLATSIHRASLAFLPAYWLYYWNISKKQIIIFFVISLICGSLFSVASVFENFGTFLGGMYETKIEGYMSRGSDFSYNESMSATESYIRSIFGKIFLLLLFLLFINKKYFCKYRGLINLFIGGVLLIPIMYAVSPTFSRVLIPYIDMQNILLVLIMISLKSNVNKFFYFILLTGMMIFRLYIKLFIDYGGAVYLPFETIFT